MEENGITKADHPQDSPNIALDDFSLFDHVKTHPTVRSVGDGRDVFSIVEEIWRSIFSVEVRQGSFRRDGEASAID
jgi:hypothetical protein